MCILGYCQIMANGPGRCIQLGPADQARGCVLSTYFSYINFTSDVLCTWHLIFFMFIIYIEDWYVSYSINFFSSKILSRLLNGLHVN